MSFNTLDDAFVFAGIHPSTGYKWLARGRSAARGEYREFYDMVEDTKVTAKMLTTNVVAGRARTDWKAALALLERRFPKEWGRIQKVELDDKTPSARKREGAREKVTAALARIEQRLREPDDRGAGKA